MPDPIFTRHSALRLMERGITRDHILAAVNFGSVVQSYDGKDLYALERMRVVVVRAENLIVTAWRERKENVKRKIRKARAASKKNKRRWK